MMPARLRDIVQGMVVEVHGAGGEFVQQRLPEMRARAIDERDRGALAVAQRIAEAGRQLETAGAAADDDYLMQLRHGAEFSSGSDFTGFPAPLK
jgi:hypothetical protein